MALVTADQVRLFCGIPVDRNPDDQINPFITEAQKLFVGDIAIRVFDEEHTSDLILSSNRIQASYSPIADRDYDGVITMSDVSAYIWTTANDPSTRSSVPVISVDQRSGVVSLASAIFPTVNAGGKITIDYSYYAAPIRDELVQLAVSYMTGYLYITSQTMLLPESYALGPLRYTKYQPVEKLLKNYKRTMNLLRVRIWEKVEGIEIHTIRRVIELGSDTILVSGIMIPLD